MRARVTALMIAALALSATVAGRQSVGQILGTANRATKTFQEMNFTDAEERQLGADVSAKLRERYGVVQDAAVHRYVTLVGSVLAADSVRPGLAWTFIVLDTDGVNAFAAPGGFIHITRGALALARNEAELADVLAHEIGHVTAKHTIKAIQKSKLEGALVSAATRDAFLEEVGNRLYGATLENKYDRGDEMDADKTGVTLANKSGYAPTGLGAFLTRLSERNTGLTDRSGMFASHPETQSRLTALDKLIAAQKLASTALVEARYSQSVAFRAVAVNQVAQAAPPAPAATEKPKPAATGGKGMFGLGGLNPLGRENASASTVSSAGSRGVNPDRDAKGGPNKALVVVVVSPAEIAAFRQKIAG